MPTTAASPDILNQTIPSQEVVKDDGYAKVDSKEQIEGIAGLMKIIQASNNSNNPVRKEYLNGLSLAEKKELLDKIKESLENSGTYINAENILGELDSIISSVQARAEGTNSPTQNSEIATGDNQLELIPEKADSIERISNLVIDINAIDETIVDKQKLLELKKARRDILVNQEVEESRGDMGKIPELLNQLLPLQEYCIQIFNDALGELELKIAKINAELKETDAQRVKSAIKDARGLNTLNRLHTIVTKLTTNYTLTGVNNLSELLDNPSNLGTSVGIIDLFKPAFEKFLNEFPDELNQVDVAGIHKQIAEINGFTPEVNQKIGEKIREINEEFGGIEQEINRLKKTRDLSLDAAEKILNANRPTYILTLEQIMPLVAGDVDLIEPFLRGMVSLKAETRRQLAYSDDPITVLELSVNQLASVFFSVTDYSPDELNLYFDETVRENIAILAKEKSNK